MRKLFFLFASAMLALAGLFYAQNTYAQTMATIDGINYVLVDASKQAIVTRQSEKNNNYYAIKDVISIPETVTYNDKTYTVSAIADDAFHYWQYGAFMNVVEVETAAIIIPKTVKMIGDRVFKECGAKDVFFLGENPPTLGEDNHSLLKMRIHVPYGCGPNYRGKQIVLYMGAHYWVLPWENYLLPTTKDVTIVEIESQSGYSLELPVPAKRGEEHANQHKRTAQAEEKDIVTILDTEYECVSHLKGTPFEELPYMERGLYFSLKNGNISSLLPDPTFRRYENLGPEIDLFANQSMTTLDTIADNAFKDNKVLQIIRFNRDIEIIGGYAFMGCSHLEQVQGAGIKHIYEGAFYNCPELGIVHMDDDLQIIEDYAFFNCKNFRGFDASVSDKGCNMSRMKSLTKIGKVAFANCSNIRRVAFPESLTSIGAHCFHGCKRMQTIVAPWVEPLEIDAETFDPVRQDAVLKVPTLTKNDYAKAAGWKNFRIDDSGEREIWNGDLLYHVVKKSDGVWYTGTVIGINPLFNFEAEEVVIPDIFYLSNGMVVQVKYIGDNAFTGTDIHCVTIPSAVISIGEHCFENCTKLNKLKWKNWKAEITENYLDLWIKDYAFANTALTEIEISDYNEIGAYAFRNTPLKEIKLNCLNINDGAFWGCGQLEKVIWTAEWENYTYTLRDQVFCDCVNLRDIYLPEMVMCPDICDKFATSLGVWRDVDLRKITAHVPSGTKNKYASKKYWQEMQIVEEPIKIDGICYMLNNDETATVTFETQDEKNYANLDPKEVTIPEQLEVNGTTYHVTTIGQGAFAGSPVTSIALPPMLKDIEAEAFKDCKSLVSVEWLNPNPLYGSPTIGNSAFQGCSALENVVLSPYTASLGDAAFKQCTKLATLTLPTNMYLGKDAFFGCTGLKDITVLNPNPQNIAEKGVFADVDQSKVTLHIPSGNRGKYEAADVWKNFNMEEYQTKIGFFYYFLDEASHTATLTYESTDWDLNYKGLAYDKKYVIPATVVYDDTEYKVTEIADFAFSGNNNNMSEIVLPEGIVTIGKQAFSPCMNLVSFNIPASVTSIKQDAFYLTSFVQNDANYFQGLLHKNKCLIAAKDDILKDYAFPEIEPDTRLIAGGALAYCQYGPSKIPASVKYICEGAFEKNKVVTFLNMENCPELTTIERWAFRNCPNLETVDFSHATQSIGDSAFFGSQVHEILLPKSLDMIGVGAFDNCTKLNWVIIPAVNRIGDNTFKNNTIARNVYVRAQSPDLFSIGANLFEGMDPAKSTLYVPFGCKANYEKADQWKEFVIKEENPCIDGVYYRLDEENGTAAVAPEIFNSTNNYFDLTGDIVIPSNISVGGKVYQVTSVAGYAFANCLGVTSVTLPNSIKEIGDYAFYNCYIRGKMKLQEGLKKVGKYAFSGTGLSFIHLPYTLTEIGEKAFFTGYMAVRTERNEPLDIAGLNVFNHPEDVRCDLYVPYGSKADYAKADEWKEFCHIYEMGAQIGGLYYELGESPYQYAWVEPESDDADNYSYLPADLVIPEKVIFNEEEYPVMGINPKAFKGCKQLRTVKILASLSSISDDAFNGCSNLESINFNKGLIDIGAHAFEGCALTSLDIPSSTDEIGQYAFMGCTGLTKIIDRAPEHPDISARYVFDGVDVSQIELFVPFGAQDDYMYADVWQEFYTVEEYETEITVVSEDDSKGTVTGSGIFEKGSKTDISAEPAEGYVFVGWDDSQDNPFDAQRTITVGETPETFTAAFEPRQLYIQFKDWDGTILRTAKVPYGGSVETESFEPTRKGYSFTGWSMSPSGLTDDEEITATYAINSYELTINAEHGVVTAHTIAEEEVNLKAIQYGTVIVLDVKADENYHFKQWENGSETMYRIFTIEDDKTVTATFEHDPYTVTFLDKDGKTLKTEQVAMGGSATAPEAPAVEGYTFTGWDKDFSAVKEDMVITAQYAINTFTVRFYDHSDNVISTQTVNWNEAALEPELADWDGHTFTSWSADFDHVQSDLDIKPIYDVQVYKVTFLGFNDTELKVENVEYGKNATAPDAPEVEGYTFTGWDKAFDNVTSDLTVKAKYEINHYALTLVAGHGTIAITDESGEHSLNPDMVMHGTIVKLIVTADDGYLFKGWSDSNTDNPRYVTVTEDKTFTALFEKEPDDPTGVEEVESQKSKVESTKLLRDGMLYILREGKMYNAQGQKVQ